ncbi:hypothetical protein BDZ89DRAFT_1048505 [Hymenopellis radicata]|nr:hypothetical protein BDZ89DRAFT_1048505 [Hymenopellis radicata]
MDLDELEVFIRRTGFSNGHTEPRCFRHHHHQSNRISKQLKKAVKRISRMDIILLAACLTLNERELQPLSLLSYLQPRIDVVHAKKGKHWMYRYLFHERRRVLVLLVELQLDGLCCGERQVIQQARIPQPQRLAGPRAPRRTLDNPLQTEQIKVAKMRHVVEDLEEGGGGRCCRRALCRSAYSPLHRQSSTRQRGGGVHGRRMSGRWPAFRGAVPEIVTSCGCGAFSKAANNVGASLWALFRSMTTGGLTSNSTAFFKRDRATGLLITLQLHWQVLQANVTTIIPVL